MLFWAKVRTVVAAAVLVGGMGTSLAFRASAQEVRPEQTDAGRERARAGEPDKQVPVPDFNREKAEEIYKEFNAFCMRYFGAEKEPLIYEKFGRELKLIKEGSWQHVSENSACIAWETNLPARGYIEYGETDRYGLRTTEEERHFYIHVHHISGLETGKTYHYRLVSLDERGNRLATEDATVTPRKIEGAIYVPGNMAGPPFNLDKDGVYVLTRDIVADGTAFNVLADKIRLDLNGHTVTYNGAPGVKNLPPGGGDPNPKSARLGAPGIRAPFELRKKAEICLYNGAIVQGKGNGGFENAEEDMFCSPIYGAVTEIAGVRLDYYGTQVYGVYCAPKAAPHAHHNVLIDKGIRMVNRHSGSRAIGGALGDIHHNLVKRCRHVALLGAQVRSNEVYVDSWATNAYGIWLGNRSVVVDNRIFGTGYLVGGIFLSEYKRSGDMTPVVSDKKVLGNLVHLAMMKPTTRSDEYGAMSSGAALRLNYGTGNMEVRDNLLLGDAWDGAAMKGAWIATNFPVAGATFEGNTFKVILHGKVADSAARSGGVGGCGCIGIDGLGSEKGEPIIFQGNTFISNVNHVHQDEPKGGYLPEWAEWKGQGYGNSAVFYDNRFVRIENRDDYTTLDYGLSSNKASWGTRYFDSLFEGGAGYDKARFIPRSKMKYPAWPNEGEARREFSVGWTLTVHTAPGAEVSVKDKSGAEVFAGAADAKGHASIRLLEYTGKSVGEAADAQKTRHTPHKVTVEKDGKRAEKDVVVDRKQTLEVVF